MASNIVPLLVLLVKVSNPRVRQGRKEVKIGHPSRASGRPLLHCRLPQGQDLLLGLGGIALLDEIYYVLVARQSHCDILII